MACCCDPPVGGTGQHEKEAIFSATYYSRSGIYIIIVPSRGWGLGGTHVSQGAKTPEPSVPKSRAACLRMVNGRKTGYFQLMRQGFNQRLQVAGIPSLPSPPPAVATAVTVTLSENHDSRWASDVNLSPSFACSCALLASRTPARVLGSG